MLLLSSTAREHSAEWHAFTLSVTPFQAIDLTWAARSQRGDRAADQICSQKSKVDLKIMLWKVALPLPLAIFGVLRCCFCIAGVLSNLSLHQNVDPIFTGILG